MIARRVSMLVEIDIFSVSSVWFYPSGNIYVLLLPKANTVTMVRRLV